MDVRITWTKAGLFVLACGVGGVGLGYLVAATLLDRLLHPR